ncbi:DUF7064 domain-containing protein [Denitromonas ohlonensis]|uniref:DUF7064 domain-containing protein n=2 Tax=Denitromonas TaxID=139331 RepID=A0A557SDM9_9RHOO|nr:hypothetical protein [Denitromonas ohlonensis]TVO63574.1 hypothetical protein FHP90_13930 [Denitromonas ohlonensis]TVO75451.1 hypothetical protein FHP89_13965 [Denitromonas ohlonensis]
MGKELQAGDGARFSIDPLHDSRHVLKADPLARESLVFMLQLPEHDLAAFVYTWVSGLGKAGSAFVVYGPAIGEVIADFCDGVYVPVDAGFNDWTVGKVRVRHGRPFEDAVVEVGAGGRASLEYAFEAVHPAYSYGSHADGCPGWVADDRIEQSGRVRGVLTLDGRRIPFDTMGHRDHSWGTRDWFFSQHWKWLEAQAGPDLVVHFWEVEAAGRTVLRGYVLRDGRMAEVTGVDVKFEHDAQLTHTAVIANVQDDLGRTTQVVGKTYAMYPFVVSPEMTLNEASMSVTIEGRAGVGHVEMAWPTAYLAHVASRDISSGSAVIRGLPRSN